MVDVRTLHERTKLNFISVLRRECDMCAMGWDRCMMEGKSSVEQCIYTHAGTYALCLVYVLWGADSFSIFKNIIMIIITSNSCIFFKYHFLMLQQDSTQDYTNSLPCSLKGGLYLEGWSA